MTNTDPFMNGITLNCNSVIGANFQNLEGTAMNKIKLVITIWYIDKNLLSNFVFVFETAIIGAQKASINGCLSVFGERKDIGGKREV